MKKLNFFAIIASVMLLSACGEQRQEDSNYDTAPDATQQAPSDVYEDEGEVIQEETDVIEEEDGAVDLNIDRDGADADINTEEVDVGIDTREEEDSVNNVQPQQ